MATNPVKNKKSHIRRGLSAGEGRRALIATAALSSIFLLALFVTTGSFLSPDQPDKSPLSKIAPLSASTGDESAHRVASIVIESGRKGRCEERRFDNRTGKILSATSVDCDARLEPERDTTPSEHVNRERVRAILGAFRK